MIFMVLSLCFKHCKSLLGLSGECRLECQVAAHTQTKLINLGCESVVRLLRSRSTFAIVVLLSLKAGTHFILPYYHSGRTSVFGQQISAVLHSTCSWRVTTVVSKPSTTDKLTQPFILSGVIKRVPAFIGWGKGGNVTSAGRQVTLCDPIWHVSYHSSEEYANC